ncbi:Chemotaxis protein methyltransferase [Aquisphaera giovannonii]|uniref:protein-glutamate O-methyltransferase n=1 Tax=Aquisphaera giovannonii TaxID=406548 RepID=A0A5B9VYB8_9BACT|nr:protein-glutamate O-methyltransferase CheR [Aquisphaera giovannonii]QEH33159.1 Chemotaxis protein methyltransferase [Aquisphaera giovannonii]
MATSGMLPPSPNEPEPWSEKDFGPIVAFLRHQIGITLETHRMGLLQARLRSRLQTKGFQSFTQFHEQVLRIDPAGWGTQLLVDLSTVNHTSFFREPAHFNFLCQQVGAWLKEAPGTTVRIWSAGCSSGQEPYSIAIALAEALPPHGLAKVEIWASDLSLEMLKAAAGAIYTQRDVQGVSPSRLRRFFMLGRGPREGSFKVVPEVRDLVKYRHIDLRQPTWALPSDFHVIFCRNVSIYFSDEERLVLLERLSHHLRPGGWLIMGNGEILPSVPASLRKHSPSLYQREA